MKTVIVYYSMSGNVKFVSHEIARELGADMIELVPSKSYPTRGVRKFIWGGKSAVMGERPALEPYTFDAEKYDRVVFASPVWASNFAPPIRTFIFKNRVALDKKAIAAVICCSGSGAERALEKMREELDISAFEESLILVDPKDKPSAEKVRLIQDFVDALK